ncbi:MAG: ABC transporter ATP-binding protein [bacterium]
MQYYTKQTFKIFWQHALKYKFSILLTVFFILICSTLQVVSPYYYKVFFDVLATTKDRTALVHTLLIILTIYLIEWIFWRASGFVNTYFQTSIMRDLAVTCFSYLHKHSFTFFNNNFVGSLVKKVNRFYRAFEGITDRILWDLLPILVNITIITAVLSRRSVYLGIAIIVWIFIYITINYLFATFKLKYDIERSEQDSKVTGILADSITNHANLKLFNGYKRENKYFYSESTRLTKMRRFTWNLSNIFDAIQGLFMVCLEVGIFYYAISLWQNGILTIGDFVLIQAYLLRIFLKLWDFGRVIRNFYENLADAEEMTEVLLTPHEIIDKKNAKKIKITNGAIEFKNVTFCYNKTRCVVEKLNLKIKPKEKIALVGPSGAGKTTLVKLLLRMHNVTGGDVLIDKQKVRDVTQESLWQNISMVPQDPILFHRSLLENIRYGKPEATDDQVFKAAKMANCHQFISEFPAGYETTVGERGVKLSGGERQRVAIARAILRSAPILVLDEATSSLDSESEHLIQDALDNLMKNKTVIVIAHRLSTIMKVDRIIVVDEGGIIEQGTHQELIKLNKGTYKKLWKIQAGGFVE